MGIMCRVDIVDCSESGECAGGRGGEKCRWWRGGKGENRRREWKKKEENVGEEKGTQGKRRLSKLIFGQNGRGYIGNHRL
jgi:hypothetical protein